MQHLFVMDPLGSLNLAGDSSVALMRAANARGDGVFICEPVHLFVRDGRTSATARRCETPEGPEPFAVGEPVVMPTEAFDVVWMRKDPPFDMAYILATYMLDLVAPSTLVVNDPKGLKLFNEKIWAMHFAHLQPPTLLTSDAALIHAFVDEQPGGTVLKPWDGNGGRGVLITHKGDKNLGSMIELLTEQGRSAIIAQAYVPDVAHGDKRILLFDGEPVAAMMRIPGTEDHRANLHVGATAARTTLTARDLAICEALREPLKSHGQIFTGIDVIGGFLTEINVTSPTGFRHIGALEGRNLAVELLGCVDRLVAERRP